MSVARNARFIACMNYSFVTPFTFTLSQKFTRRFPTTQTNKSSHQRERERMSEQTKHDLRFISNVFLNVSGEISTACRAMRLIRTIRRSHAIHLKYHKLPIAINKRTYKTFQATDKKKDMKRTYKCNSRFLMATTKPHFECFRSLLSWVFIHKFYRRLYFSRETLFCIPNTNKAIPHFLCRSKCNILIENWIIYLSMPGHTVICPHLNQQQKIKWHFAFGMKYFQWFSVNSIWHRGKKIAMTIKIN